MVTILCTGIVELHKFHPLFITVKLAQPVELKYLTYILIYKSNF